MMMGTGEKDERAVGLWPPGGAFQVLSVAGSATSSHPLAGMEASSDMGQLCNCGSGWCEKKLCEGFLGPLSL